MLGLCDLIIDCKRYAPLFEASKLNSNSILQEPQKDFQQTPKQVTGGKKPSKISPSMKEHNLFPERRPGRGPKFVKTVKFDRTYALSSTKAVKLLQDKRQLKGKTTKGQPVKKKQRCRNL